MLSRSVLVTLGFLGLAACGTTRVEPLADEESELREQAEAPPEVAEPLDDPSYRRGETRGGNYLLLWKPIGGPVPKNKPFELEVRLYKRTGAVFAPLSGSKLAFSGWMPDHGHGMIRRPAAFEEGEGKYRVRGMLFHMGGHWQFFIDVIDSAHSERVEFDILL
jgi:hypothetical protein